MRFTASCCLKDAHLPAVPADSDDTDSLAASTAANAAAVGPASAAALCSSDAAIDVGADALRSQPPAPACCASPCGPPAGSVDVGPCCPSDGEVACSDVARQLALKRLHCSTAAESEYARYELASSFRIAPIASHCTQSMYSN